MFAVLPAIRLQIILLLFAAFVGLNTYRPAPAPVSAFVLVELWTICNLLIGLVTPIPILPPDNILIFSVLFVLNIILFAVHVPNNNAPLSKSLNPTPSIPIYAKLLFAEFENPIYDEFVVCVLLIIICLVAVPAIVNLSLIVEVPIPILPVV